MKVLRELREGHGDESVRPRADETHRTPPGDARRPS